MTVVFEKICKNCIALESILREENKSLLLDYGIKLLSYANMKGGYYAEEVIERLPYPVDKDTNDEIIKQCKDWYKDNSEYCYFSCNNVKNGSLCNDCRFKGVIYYPADLGIIDEDGVIKTKQFPIDSLPPVFKDFTQQASKAIKCPPDFIATSLLVASGALIGTTRALQVSPTWKIPANLYACLIGSPSSKKSPAMSAVLKYVENIENELLDKYSEELEKFDKSKDEQKPKLERLITNNSTVEAIMELLADNQRGMLIFSDELNSWLNSFGEYKTGKNNGDKQFYLSAWNASRYVCDRKGKSPIISKKTFVSVLGSIQPNIIRNLENLGDGFFERVIFSFPEQSDYYFGSSVYEIDVKIAEALSNQFSKLHKLFYSGEKIIGLSIEARKCFEEFEEELASTVQSQYFNPILEALYCKISGTCAKIALILHCIKDDSTNLSKETMQSAIDITKYYLAHSRQILLIIAKEATYRIVDNVYKWILQKRFLWLQPSTISKYNVAGIKSADDAKAVLNRLIEEHKIIYDSDNKRYLVLEE